MLLVVASFMNWSSQNEPNAFCMEATTQRSQFEAVSSTTLELGKLPCPMTSSNPSFPQLRHAHVQSQLTPSLHYSGTLLMVAGALSPPASVESRRPPLDSSPRRTTPVVWSIEWMRRSSLCQPLASLTRMSGPDGWEHPALPGKGQANEARHPPELQLAAPPFVWPPFGHLQTLSCANG